MIFHHQWSLQMFNVNIKLAQILNQVRFLFTNLMDIVHIVLHVVNRSIEHRQSMDSNYRNSPWWLGQFHGNRHNFQSIVANDLFHWFDVQLLRVIVSQVPKDLELPLTWYHRNLRAKLVYHLDVMCHVVFPQSHHYIDHLPIDTNF